MLNSKQSVAFRDIQMLTIDKDRDNLVWWTFPFQSTWSKTKWWLTLKIMPLVKWMGVEPGFGAAAFAKEVSATRARLIATSKATTLKLIHTLACSVAINLQLAVPCKGTQLLCIICADKTCVSFSLCGAGQGGAFYWRAVRLWTWWKWSQILEVFGLWKVLDEKVWSCETHWKLTSGDWPLQLWVLLWVTI